LGAGDREFDSPHPGQQIHACISTGSGLRVRIVVNSFGLTVNKSVNNPHVTLIQIIRLRPLPIEHV
jgi:hypothetical protein